MVENQHSPEHSSGFTGVVELARKSAVLILRVESLFLLVLALVQCYLGLTRPVTAMGAFIGVIIFCILGSAGLYFASNGFARRESWGRAPGLLANLIALGVAYFMVTGDYLLGYPLAVLAFAGSLSTLLGYRE